MKGRNWGRRLCGHVAKVGNLPDTALSFIQVVVLQNMENSNALHNFARHAVCVSYRRARIPEGVKNFFRRPVFGISNSVNTNQQDCQDGSDEGPLLVGLAGSSPETPAGSLSSNLDAGWLVSFLGEIASPSFARSKSR